MLSVQWMLHRADGRRACLGQSLIAAGIRVRGKDRWKISGGVDFWLR